MSVPETAGVIAGYASLFNRADLAGDIVMPGAFAASLARKGARGVRMLFQHDPAEPVGVWDEIVDDGVGLRVKGRLLAGVPKAREVLALLQAGALDGLSIGFRTQEAQGDRRKGARRLTRVELLEISIVTFPMLPQARVDRVAPLG